MSYISYFFQYQIYNHRYFSMSASQNLPDPHQNLYIIEDNCFQTNTVTKYIKGNFLGKGGFARCYELISQQTKDVFAVKIIQKSTLIKQRSKLKLMSEIKIHESLDHNNVVKFLHNFEDNLNVYIVLQLCTNKTLNDLIKKKRRFSESEVKYFMLQVLDGLEYLHSQKIIHRDLKLGNLFLNQNMGIKIGDFGLATRIDFYGQKKKTICGTPNYIAPEILQSKGHSYEVDVWSVGVIIYTLIYGRPPFESKDVKDTYKKIKECTFSFPQTVHASSSLKGLVSSILQKDPHKRPTIKQLKSYDFFTETNLPRQPSISFTTQRSHSATKEDRQLSDNGKLYTNNDFGASKDICQKSQEKFLATDRTNSITKSATKDIGRANSHKVLKDSSKNNLDKTPSRKSIVQPKYNYITVKKWIDYSSKYGIGYILSNNMIGVYFNDSTKILTSSEDYFYYIQRIQKEDITNKYTFKDHPYLLKKKVSLFNHFKGYLQSETENKSPPKETQIDQKKLIYVRRWFRSKHAVIFRLNNKSVQVIFIDQSQLLINSLSKQVLYTNKYKEKTQYPLSEIMQSDNRQLIKRFQYTKEVLNQMASNIESKKSTN